MARETWTYEKCYELAKECGYNKEFMTKYPKAYGAARRNGWIKDYSWFKRPGGYHTFWTKEECYEEARKYKSRVEFSRSARGAYKAARNHGWIDDYTWLKRPETYNQLWNRETCEAEARKYTTLKDFRENSKSAHDAAYNHGWLQDFVWLEKREIIWTYEACYEEAKKYTHKKAFQKGCFSAYTKALENDWLKDYDWFKRPENYNKKWNRETCFEEAKKYTCRAELSHGTPGAYNVAWANGWLDEYTWFQKPENYNKKWNYETCYEEAKKYTKIIDFMKGSFGAYDVARENGWMKDYTWIERQLKEWTYENCYEEAIKYGSKHEFEKGCSSAYVAARRNGWLSEYTWFKRPEVYNKVWHKEECFEIARKFETKRDFGEANISAYRAAINNKWINEMTWFKPALPKEFDENATNYVVYVYQDNDLKVAYVGLTNNIKRRHYCHKSNRKKNDTLANFYFERNLPIPEPKILEENLTPIEAQFYEGYYVEKYRNEGWNVLNKAKTGVAKSSIGGGYIKYTFEKAVEISKHYPTIKAFRKGDKKWYKHSLKKGWLKDFDWLKDESSSDFWTQDKIFEESKKYKYFEDFKRECKDGYKEAQRKNLLGLLTWLTTKRRKYSDEEILEEAKKYNTLEEYKENSQFFHMASRRRLTKLMTWLKHKNNAHYWTKELIIEESKKYEFLKDFRLKSSAYDAAIRMGIVEELLWLKRGESQPKTIWTKEKIFEIARQYETMKEFRSENPNVYSAAKNKHLLQEMTWLKRSLNQHK